MRRRRTTDHWEEEEKGSPTFGHEEKKKRARHHVGHWPWGKGRALVASYGEEGEGTSGPAHQRWRRVGGLSG